MSRVMTAALALLSFFVAACKTTPTAPATVSLAESIDAQMARHEAIAWSPKRPLTWADFRGTPPASTSAAAETAYTLFHGAQCTRSRFEFLVVAAFRPKDSWVRQAVLKSPADSVRALRHEQTHFDIAELHARRMRRYFSEMMAPCKVPTDQLASMAERFIRDERGAQEKYDDETNHSRDAARQTLWDKDIASQLAGLGRFAR